MIDTKRLKHLVIFISCFFVFPIAVMLLFKSGGIVLARVAVSATLFCTLVILIYYIFDGFPATQFNTIEHFVWLIIISSALSSKQIVLLNDNSLLRYKKQVFSRKFEFALILFLYFVLYVSFIIIWYLFYGSNNNLTIGASSFYSFLTGNILSIFIIILIYVSVSYQFIVDLRKLNNNRVGSKEQQ